MTEPTPAQLEYAKRVNDALPKLFAAELGSDHGMTCDEVTDVLSRVLALKILEYNSSLYGLPVNEHVVIEMLDVVDSHLSQRVTERN